MADVLQDDRKLYGNRRPDKQGIYFPLHMHHMTSEDLSDKVAIAAELAHRDIQIDELRFTHDLRMAAVYALNYRRVRNLTLIIYALGGLLAGISVISIMDWL